MLLGVMASINQEVDVDTATIVAEEFGVTVTEVEPEEDPTDIIEIEDAPENIETSSSCCNYQWVTFDQLVKHLVGCNSSN